MQGEGKKVEIQLRSVKIVVGMERFGRKDYLPPLLVRTKQNKTQNYGHQNKLKRRRPCRNKKYFFFTQHVDLLLQDVADERVCIGARKYQTS